MQQKHIMWPGFAAQNSNNVGIDFVYLHIKREFSLESLVAFRFSPVHNGSAISYIIKYSPHSQITSGWLHWCGELYWETEEGIMYTGDNLQQS